jgi:hypothetical protein
MEKGTLGSPFFRYCPGNGRELSRLHYLFAANAAGADPNPLRPAVNQNADGLEIGHPTPLPPVVGVADMVAGRGALGANGADTCHNNNSPLVVLGLTKPLNLNHNWG